jgi:hypothetical protein
VADGGNRDVAGTVIHAWVAEMLTDATWVSCDTQARRN